ncbi:MAG: DUF3185 family protein [Opitutaceae bacterium]
MYRILGIVIILIGAYLIYLGVNRSHSLAGKMDSAAASVSNSISGNQHQTTQTVEWVAGGVLVIVGLAVASRRRVA